MSGLSDALGAANTAGLSARAIARAAKERGHSVNHDTAARYLRGDHGTPDESTLVAFAEVLNVPLRTLRAAADLPTESIDPYLPPPEASRLSRRQRRAVDEIIRAMLESGGGSTHGRGATGRELADPQSPTTGAANHGQAEPPPNA
jgi:transcriptional regulator with XRE-family HTH domain